jgi:acyl carrier protein
MSENNDLNQRIRNYVYTQFPLARQRSIVDAHPLLEGGIVDSLGILDLVGFLENEFGIAISDDDLLPENFRSITTIAAFIRAKMEQPFSSEAGNWP